MQGIFGEKSVNLIKITISKKGRRDCRKSLSFIWQFLSKSDFSCASNTDQFYYKDSFEEKLTLYS